MFPPCWLFGLKCPCTGAYRLLGGTKSLCQNGGLEESSHQWLLPSTSATSVLAPQWATGDPLPLQETLQDQQVGLAQASKKSLLCFGRSVHKTFCVSSKSGVSVSPILWSSLHSSPSDFQSQMLWGLLLLMPDLQIGYPDMGLRMLTPVGELMWYNCSAIHGSPIRGVWDLITLRVHPSYCLSEFLLYVFGCRISFVVGSRLVLFFFINICSAISCDFGALTTGGKFKVLLLWPFKPLPTIYFFTKFVHRFLSILFRSKDFQVWRTICEICISLKKIP